MRRPCAYQSGTGMLAMRCGTLKSCPCQAGLTLAVALRERYRHQALIGFLNPEYITPYASMLRLSGLQYCRVPCEDTGEPAMSLRDGRHTG